MCARERLPPLKPLQIESYRGREREREEERTRERERERERYKEIDCPPPHHHVSTDERIGSNFKDLEYLYLQAKTIILCVT